MVRELGRCEKWSLAWFANYLILVLNGESANDCYRSSIDGASWRLLTPNS
jgi:hypothetical protein